MAVSVCHWQGWKRRCDRPWIRYCFSAHPPQARQNGRRNQQMFTTPNFQQSHLWSIVTRPKTNAHKCYNISANNECKEDLYVIYIHISDRPTQRSRWIYSEGQAPCLAAMSNTRARPGWARGAAFTTLGWRKNWGKNRDWKEGSVGNSYNVGVKQISRPPLIYTVGRPLSRNIL